MDFNKGEIWSIKLNSIKPLYIYYIQFDFYFDWFGFGLFGFMAYQPL